MNTEEAIPPHIPKIAQSFRITGWWFLILGSLICIQPIAILFDPNATMNVNGVPTKEFGVKIGTAAMLFFFGPVLGGIFALSPRKKLEAAIAAFDRFAKSIMSSQLSSK